MISRLPIFDRVVAVILSWVVPGATAFAMTPPAPRPSSPITALAPTFVPASPEEPSSSLEAATTSMSPHGGDHDDDDLRPILECVVRHSSSSYTAYFGFKNETSQSVTVPVGSNNAFSPAPQNRNQPSTFPRGRSPYYPDAAFSVPFNGSNLTWTLRGRGHHTRSVTAKSSSPRCQAPPAPTPTPTAAPTPLPSPTPPPVCATPVFGPQRFTRTCDDNGPTVYNKTFALPAGASGPFTLRVRNGDTQGRNKTTSAEVKINGVEVVGESDFSNNVVTFTKTLPGLAANNQLYVRVKGAPGSTFTIEICGANQADANPPVIDWLTPVEGEILGDPTPLYRVRYSDVGSGLDLATLKILVDGADRTAAFHRQPDEASHDGDLTLADGGHSVLAEIKDVAGNTGVSTRAFRVDATDPGIAVAEPASGSLTRTTRPQIRLSFADGGALPSGVDPATLAVSIDGVDVTSAFSVTGGVATGIPPLPLTDGPHRVDASISDRVGNEGAGFTLFTIDTVAPVLTAISPVQGQTLGASSVSVLVQYADGHGLDLASFEARLDGSALALTIDADSASGGTGVLPDGPHALILSIADLAGNVKTSTVSFSTDTGKPEIFIVPTNGQPINSRRPEIVVSYSDAQGIAPGSLKITVNGVVRTAEFTQAGSEARATLAEPLPIGLNSIAAEVRDGASNLGTATSSFTLDMTPPAIVVVSPGSGAFLSDTTPDIEVTLTDDATSIANDVTRVFLDGVDVTADFTLGETGARGTLTAPLSEGPHTLEVLAADGAANPAILTTQFHIDITPPSLDFASPRVDGYTNDPTPEIWLRLNDPAGPTGQMAGGVDLASTRVFLLSPDVSLPDTDITSLFSPTADGNGLRGELAEALADGSHRLRASVRDAAGNESDLTVGFVVDTVAPIVAIDQPQSNTFLNSAEPTVVLLYGDARSGVAPDLIQITVDGIERTASLVPASGGATLTLSRSLGFDLADGPHRVEARVVDLAGNATDAEPVTFGVDTVAPVAAVQAPIAESFTGTPAPAIQFTLTDAAPSSRINPDLAKAFLDGVEITGALAFTSTGGAAEPVVVSGVGAVPTPLGDGLHTLLVTAIDNANNAVEISVQFTVDNGAPVLTLDIPEEGRLIGESALTNGRATVTGTVIDLDANVAATCSTGAGQGAVTLTAGDYTCAVPVAEGANTVVVTAADSTGHSSTLSRPLTLDQTAPVISISAPTDGTFAAATSLSVTGTVSDQSAVVVTVNGGPATVNPGTGGGPSTFEATGVAVGAGPTAAIDVAATDAAGNTSTTHLTVRVDRNAPLVTITSPSSGAYLRGGVTTVTAEVVDETTTILDLNGVAGTKTGCEDVSAETRRCTFTAEVPLIAGNTTIVATAFDEAGNRGVNQVSASVDNTPPTITISTPAEGLATNSTSIFVAGTATDAAPLTLTINGQSVSPDGSGSFSGAITSDILGVPFAGMEGPTGIVFTATDAAGNTTSTTVVITLDRTAPALSMASPLSGTVAPNSSLSVLGTVSDATPVTVIVQGVPAQVTGQAYSRTLTDLGEGPLVVTVRAIDAAGNEVSLTREVEIDLGPPTVAITSPAAGALVREAFVVLAYTVSDRSRTTLTINGSPAHDCPGVTPCGRSQPVNLVDGDNTFSIEATDAGGRTSTAQVTVTRDSIPPTLDLQAPATVSRGRAATASVAATDNLAVERVEIRLGSTVLCAAATSCSAPIVIPEGANPGDSLTITAEATDRAGNTTTTSRTVRVTTDGVVTGAVLNDLTSLPVAGASVTLLGANPRSATTDSNGRFNLPVSDVFATLRVTKAGMTSVDRAVSVASGSGTVPIDARLTVLADATAHSPVIPATNPPATVPPPSVTPAEAGVHGVPGPLSLALPNGSHRVTLLSQQGLPNLLPPGFSPIVAFAWTSDVPSGSATASFAMPAGAATVPDSTLVHYDLGMRDWRIVTTGLAATDGAITTDIPGLGSYALIVPDTVTPAMTIGAPGEALVGLPVLSIPATATSESRVDPPILPPTGGTATGSMRLGSPASLPSGTVVQAEVEEFYTLTSGEEASAAKRSIDLVAFKRKALATSWGTVANAGSIAGATVSTICVPEVLVPPVDGGGVEHLCASFPITPSRTYGNAALKEGRVHLDLLAGRENARGTVGGNAATTITDGLAQLNVAAGSLDEDTAIAFFAYDTFSSFIPFANGITPLGEVTVDVGSSTLNTSASLTFHNVAAAAGDTLVVARADRAEFDGIPRLQVVALADVVTGNGETSAVSRVETGLPGLALDGIRTEGRYTLLRLANPIGWLNGVTTAGGSPVRALVSTNTLPFFATSSGSGAFAIPSALGAVALTARVLGRSLVGSASAVAIEGSPVTADIALQGTVSQASVVPPSGSVGIEVNEPLALTSPVALDPNTVIPANISLRRVPPLRCADPDPSAGLDCAATQVPLRFVLSGSGKLLSIVPTGAVTIPPTPALEFSTDYRLEVTGLLDVVGGLVTAPTINFRTKDDVKPVYNLKVLTFSFPNAEGLVTVSAPAGTFPPGTEILIINSGNGVVLGLIAGNDGEVNGTLPAGLSDVLLVTVTDPFGNTTSFENSTFINPATGESAVGPGGGVIEGPQGTAMTIPEGALSEGVAFKLDVLTPEQYDAQFPNQRPAFGTRPIGMVLKVSAAREGSFNRPVKLTLNVPSNFAATHPGADPRDAVFYALKRSILPGGVVAYEVVDHAFAVCPGDAPGGDLPARDDPGHPTCEASELSVKTASPPHPEFTGNFQTDTYILLTYDWSSVGPRTALAGTVVGRVRREAWGSRGQAGQIRYEPIQGARVFGSDASGNPLQSGNALFTTSQRDGTYTLWDDAYQGGPVTVHAVAGEERATGLGFEGNPQDTSASWGPFQSLRFYQNKAHVDVLFESQAPPPPEPDVDIVVMRDADKVDTKGLSQVGAPLRIGFRNNRPNEVVNIGALDINGQSFTVTADQTGKFAGITQDAWTPSQAGAYVLQTTALSPIAGTIPVSTTVRIVAAGGGVEMDPTRAPRVIDQQTYPRKGARNISIAAFPSVAFTEPVVGIGYTSVLLTRTDLLTGETSAEAFKISGITAAAQVVPDVTASPTLPVTAITLLPISGLKYKHRYTLSLTDAIVDLDVPPKSLIEYSTTFETFGPESIPPENEPESYTTTGFYVAKDADGEPVSMWALKHAIAGSSWLSLLTGYDLSNPVEVAATSSASFIGRPMDLVGEGTTMAMATAPGVRSIPSNVRLFDVSDAANPVEVGAATLAPGAGQGAVSRITLRGNRIYAGTMKRGIQIIDTDDMRASYKPCNSQVCDVAYFNMQRDLSTDGVGFGMGAVVRSFPVAGANAAFSGIKSIQQSDEPLIVAVGSFGLALAKEQSSGLMYQGYPANGADRLDYAYALDVATIGGYDIALIAGLSGGRQVLMTVDVTNPPAPVVRGVIEIQTSGRGVVDILIQGTTAYVSTQKQTTPASLAVEVFDLSPIDTIAHLGSVEGVGGRLAISGKLLYGAASTTFGNALEGLGGVRTAALGTMALIDATNPPVVVVGEGPRAAEDFKVRYRVIPASVDVESAQIEYRHGDATIGAPIGVTLNPVGRGELPLQLGFTFPTVGATLARPRLTIRTTQGEDVVGPLRSWRHEQPTVELVFDDDQEEDVTADRPEVEVRVTSAEWYRRFAEAQDKGAAPPPTKDVTFASVSPAGIVSPNQVVSRDGIFETTLANLVAPAPGHQVRAFIGPVTLGVSDPAAVLPGPAQTVELTPSQTDLPLDGASEALITLTARDIRGNLVLDGTGVFWETDGDGEFVEPREATSNGIATIRYRAGESKTGPVTITAHVDDVEQTLTLQQHLIQVAVALDHTVAFLDTPSIEVTATATSVGGPISPNAVVSAISSSGKMTITAPLVNGVLRARWEPAGTQYRHGLAFSVAVADARGQSPIIPWRATLTPQESGGEEAAAAGSMDGDSALAPAFSAPTAQQGGAVVPVASAFPSMIAGDRTQDGNYDLELPDGTTRPLPYKTQSSYRITGLTPGERVALSLGSNARPNARSLAHYSGTQGIVNNLAPDDIGQNDGTVAGGVQAIPLAYQGPGYSFNGSSTITVPHAPAFTFLSGFMVQVAVRPPPAANGVLVEKAGQFRLDLVNGYPRFSIQSGSAIGSPSESSVTAAQPIPENQWTLVSGRFDGTTIKLVAGDYEDTLVLPQSPNASAAPIILGQDFGGALDEIRLFDLSVAPLLTFAGGATEIQGVADSLGNFETLIRSGGALLAGAVPSGDRFAHAFAHAPGESGGVGGPSDPLVELMASGEFLAMLQDPPSTASQETLGSYVVEINATLMDSARRETTFIGVAGHEMLARAFLVIGGVWGAGPPDDPYVMAGDLVLGTIVQAITTPRDFINAFDHARTGQADKFEVLTIAMAAAGAASVVFSKKAAILGKMRKLPTLLTAFGSGAEANRVLGKRLMKGVKEVAEDLPGGKSLENIADAVDVLSAEGKQALSNVLNAVGDQGRSLDKLDTLIKKADNKGAVITALGDAERALPRGRFRHLLSLCAACTVGTAAADGPIEVCKLTARAISGRAKLINAGYSPAVLAAAAERNWRNFDRTNDIYERLDSVFDVTESGMKSAMGNLANPLFGFAFGGQGVLKLAADIVDATAEAKRLALRLRFEDRYVSSALRLSNGAAKARKYDLSALQEVLVGGVKRLLRVRHEVKRWRSFPPSAGLQKAREEFLFDFVEHSTNANFPWEGLKWDFPELSPAQRAEAMEDLIEFVKNHSNAKRALDEAEFKRGLADVDRLKKSIFGVE